MADDGLTLSERLLALCLDRLTYLAWSKTKAAADGETPPKSIYMQLTGGEEKKESVYMSFDSGADFRAKWNEITKGG